MNIKLIHYFIHPKISYILLTSIVVLFLLSHTINQRWQADFWQHSAAIHELSISPWSPTHPYLPVNAPHEFYNPYSLALALFSRFTGLSSIMVLSIMCIINFIFLSWALYRFCKRFSKNQWSPFLTLLFVLILWGYHPWMWSGFFHLAMIGDTAPYPSCFCAALTFLAWSLFVDFATKKVNPVQPLLLSLILFIVLVSHPHTAVVLFVGLLALWYAISPKKMSKTIILGVIALISLSATYLWPYYPFIELITQSESGHNDGNIWMYYNVAGQGFVGLIFLPCLIGRLWRNRRDPICIMFVMFVFIYAYGYFSEKYALGRSIVYIMFCLQFGAADWLANIKTRTTSTRIGYLWQYVTLRIAIVIISVFTIGFFAVGVYRYRPGRNCTYSSYTFLPDYVKQTDIILTDSETSLIIPSFSGKVVGTLYFQAFIEDCRQRKETVDDFFTNKINNKERKSILRKFSVDFILLNQNTYPSESLQEDISKLGKIIYSEDDFYLIDVRDIR